MIGAFRYSAAAGSIQADIGRLLSKSTWDALMAAEGMPELFSILEEGPYRRAVAGDRTGLETIEGRLRVEGARSFLLPLAFVRGRPQELIDRLFRGFDIENLVRVLRSLHRGLSGERILSTLLPLEDLSPLPWKSLCRTQSIPDLVDRLERIQHVSRGSAYARSLTRAQGEYRRRNSVFPLEMALTLDHYRGLRRGVDRLAAGDRKHAELLIGTMIDARSLLWTLRCRIHFGFGPETTLGLALPRSDRVTGSLLQRAATEASVERVAREAYGDALPGLDRLQDKSDPAALETLELLFARFRHDRSREMLMRMPPHLGTVLSFWVLREMEVRDLITILETIRAGRPGDAARSMLAGPGRAS